MRAAHGGSARLGQPEVADLAFGDQVAHGASHILDRHVRVDAVLVEQVDMVGAQALEAGFGDGTDILGAAVQAVIGARALESELGGNHQPVAVGRQRPAEQVFVGVRTIHLGGVEEGHAALDGGLQQGDALALLHRLTVGMGQAHAAQAEGGNLQATAAQFACLHRRAPEGE